MPTVTIDTSAAIADVEAIKLIGSMTGALAKATGAPKEHVHINLRTSQFMTWGGKLGGKSGAPHTAHIRVVLGQALEDGLKKAVVADVGKLMAPHASPASTQFLFEAAAAENLAIDGLLLPDLMARDAAAPPAKKEKGAAQQAKQTPEEKAAAAAAKEAAKKKEKIYKEGGKKGVEIEGASELGGLDFFCTTLELPDGDVDSLEYSMTAMNAEPDPTAEERKGCSGAVGKMIFSAGIEQLAMVGYVPDLAFNKSSDKVDVTEWMESVCKAVAGSITTPAAAVTSVMPDGSAGKITGKRISAVVKSDPEKGKFALKDKDSAMAAAFAFLRSKDAFPEDKDDDSDDMIFGDDDNLDDYE